jgi:hypothetical protein
MRNPSGSGSLQLGLVVFNAAMESDFTMTRPVKFPLWRTVKEAYVTTIEALPQLVRITWAPLAVMVILVGVTNYALWPWRNEKAFFDLPTTVTMLGSALAGSSMAVGWHRFILLGEKVANGRSLRLDRVVLMYAAFSQMLIWVQIGVVGTVLFVGDAGEEFDAKQFGVFAAWVAGVLVAVAITSPLGLALPHVAITGEAGTALRRAWQMTRRNGVRLTFGLPMSMFPLVIFTAVAITQLPDPTTRIAFMGSSIFYEVLWATLGMIIVSFLSMVYRQLSAPGD